MLLQSDDNFRDMETTFGGLRAHMGVEIYLKTICPILHQLDIDKLKRENEAESEIGWHNQMRMKRYYVQENNLVFRKNGYILNIFIVFFARRVVAVMVLRDESNAVLAYGTAEP